jgi:hypothetical protein
VITLKDPIKKATAGTAEKKKCCICNEQPGTLQNEDESLICEDCAHYMSDLGYELSL